MTQVMNKRNSRTYSRRFATALLASVIFSSTVWFPRFHRRQSADLSHSVEDRRRVRRTCSDRRRRRDPPDGQRQPVVSPQVGGGGGEPRRSRTFNKRIKSP